MASSIAIASGKGGVGKTSIAVNLGLTMARLGQRVTLLDADFGLANAHILLGINPGKTISDVLSGDASIEQTLTETSSGMRFIGGGSGLNELLNLDQKTRYSLIRQMGQLDATTDQLIIDVPAGASDSSVAFVSAADRVLVVLVGEPTSFLDAYALIKAANLEAGVSSFGIVVNMANSQMQAKSHFEKFRQTVLRFLDVRLDYAGSMPMSPRLRQSIIARRPVAMDDKMLKENQAMLGIAKAVLAMPASSAGNIRFFDNTDEKKT